MTLIATDKVNVKPVLCTDKCAVKDVKHAPEVCCSIA